MSREFEWGGWTLDPNYPSIDLGRDGARYWMDLRRCCDSAGVLDFICQIAGKSWADDVILAGLVRALDDVIRPQRFLCSFGGSKEMTEDEMLHRVKDFAKTARWFPRSER